MPRTRPIVTIAKNGVGAFVLPCRMIVFNYCERSGSSRGIVLVAVVGQSNNK